MSETNPTPSVITGGSHVVTALVLAAKLNPVTAVGLSFTVISLALAYSISKASINKLGANKEGIKANFYPPKWMLSSEI